MADSIAPRKIAELCAKGLQVKLNLNATQVYVIATGGYVEGMSASAPAAIQVVPGAQQPYGPGEGAQIGEGLLRQTVVTLWVWWNMRMDMHQMNQQALIQQSTGLLDYIEKVRGVFALTNLGGVLCEAMRWSGTSPVAVFDEEKGILYATISYRCPFGEAMPSAVTLTAQDLA